MGVYQYTLRKATKTVDSPEGKVAVGQFAYAYKHSFWGSTAPDYKRLVARASSFAEKAFEANKNLKLAISGEWEWVEKYGFTEVYDMSNGMMSEYTEELCHKTYPIVGYIVKAGRSYKMVKEKPVQKI